MWGHYQWWDGCDSNYNDVSTRDKEWEFNSGIKKPVLHCAMLEGKEYSLA